MKFAFALSGLLLCLPVTASTWGLEPFGLSASVVHTGDDPSYALPGHDDSVWTSQSWHSVTERGVWWLRGRVDIPQRYLDSEVPVGLYISAAAAAEIWWDGQPIGQTGRVGLSREDELPGPMDAVIAVPAAAPGTNEHLLAIRFSSQHAAMSIATPVDALYFAPFGSPLRYFQSLYLPALVFGGALGLAMIFLLVLWWRDRNTDLAWLLLACSAALMQLGFEVSRAFFQYQYPWHEVRLYAIAVAATVSGIGLLGHFLSRFQLPAMRIWCIAVAGISAALLLSGMPVGLATILIIAIWLAAGMTICALAIRRRHGAGWIGFAALTLMFAAMIAAPNAFTDRSYFIALVMLLLIVFADTVRSHVRTRQERDDARHRSARLELELLKRQLRPHFLMNTLTTIQEWLDSDPGIASAAIDALASEFRLLNRIADRQLIPMPDELALCRAHLAVMSYRQERAYSLDVCGDTGFQIPPAVIHTLLENAITHANPGTREVRFDLLLRHAAGLVKLTLSTPDDATASDELQREGTGLSYVRARLREAFGDAALIRSGATDAGWQTRIQMPAVAVDATDNWSAEELAYRSER